MKRHLHLDVLGGISGDMYLAAMLDTFPEYTSALRRDLLDAGLDAFVELSLCKTRKSGFNASQVTFKIATTAPATNHWRDIKIMLLSSNLREEVKAIALDIFSHLAEAEAQCHGVDIEAVHFHEVADWDSLADIIGAASMIEQAAATWSVNSLPMGSGRVKTQHGWIPIPAPATTLLLRGFETFDDGVSGERITPTGAAILRYLSPERTVVQGTIGKTGLGAGQKEFPNVANVLRIFETQSLLEKDQDETVTEIAFEVDDMSGEEMAIALDYLREVEGIIDVGCGQEMGKKGRMRNAIRILAVPTHQDSVLNACFTQTSTLGIRFSTVQRRILHRTTEMREGWPIKTAHRPQNNTIKIESDSLAALPNLAERRKQARKSEGDQNA